MTRNKQDELADAIVARLEEVLAGQAVAEVAGDAPGDIPVYREVSAEKNRVHVRIDGFRFLQGNGGNGRFDRYDFMAHVFHENGFGDKITKGPKQVSRVQNIVLAALDEFVPLQGACGIEHISSNDAPDEDPSTHHGISRFKSIILGE